MLVVTAFCPKDSDQALRQAQWLHELGGAKGHSLLLVADTACTKTQVQEIHLSYAESYDAVELLPFVDHYRSWPRSPNDCFATAARHIMWTRPQSWFWCEPDCVFLVPNALDKLWADYQQAGKPFYGDFVSAETAGVNVIDHCSGNMIVPADLFTHAGLLLIADDIAFDVAAASQIGPQMHKSELILHRWKSPPFESWEQVQQRIFDVKPHCVLFHANKTGELITLLRSHRTSPASEFVSPVPDGTADRQSAPSVDLQTARWHGDNPVPGQIWLKVDNTGNSLGTFEFKDGKWVPAKWPRADSNYQMICTIENASEPWDDKAFSLTEIGRLSARLKQFCTGPVRTRQVRDVLRENGVIK